jgi:hypothetical protein
MTELTISQKDGLHRATTIRMRQWYGVEKATSGMACLYWMHAGLVTLMQYGIIGRPAAGTAWWEYNPSDPQMTHFGCEWGGNMNDELVRHAVLEPGSYSLPEMHCWIWLPSTGEVVDFTTEHVPEAAKRLGFEWKPTVKPPPPYIWARPESLYPRAVYLPSRDATRLAIQTLAAGHSKGTKQ